MKGHNEQRDCAYERLPAWTLLRLPLTARLTAFNFFSWNFPSTCPIISLPVYSLSAASHFPSIPYPDIMPSDKVEKKRKRASDRHERPSKKPALELQDLPPLASSVVEDDSELAPVISMLHLFTH